MEKKPSGPHYVEVKPIILKGALESFEFHFHVTSRQAYNVDYMVLIVLIFAQQTKPSTTRTVHCTNVLPYTLRFFLQFLCDLVCNFVKHFYIECQLAS